MKSIRIIFRNLIVALSLYSRIPMPHFTWEEDDMKYNLAFLPLVGVIIGALEYALVMLCIYHELPEIFGIAFFCAIPLLVTGGFHVDGFMDTQDAFNSYKSKEEKLRILKDPHIGAFAVISLAAYGLIFAGALSLVFAKMDKTAFIFLCMSFVISRILTGLTSLGFGKAKKEGMLRSETDKAGKGCLAALSVMLVICIISLEYISPVLTAIMSVALLGFTAYYLRRTKREFGGITGDTAGYFVTMSELVMLITLAAYLYLWIW